MATSEEEDNQIVYLVNKLLTNVEISRKNLLQPTREYMSEFYRSYLVELDKSLAVLLNDGSSHILGDVLTITSEDICMTLYIYLKNIANQVGMQYFKLRDVLQPTSRTKTTVNLLINLLLYIQNNIPSGQKIVGHINALAAAHNSLKQNIDDYRSRISQISSEIATDQEEYARACAEHDEAVKFALKVEVIRKNDEQETIKIESELNALEEDLNQKEEYLKTLSDNNAVLRAHAVNEEEFENLKAMRNNFGEQLQELQDDSESYQDALKSKGKQIEHFENLIQLLESLDFSVLEMATTIEEKKRCIAEYSAASVKRLEETEAMKASLRGHRENREDLENKTHSTTYIFNNQLAKLCDEKVYVKQKIREVKQSVREEREKLAAEEEDIRKQCADVEAEIESNFQNELAVYRKLLQTENELNNSFNDKLDQIKSILERAHGN